MFDKGLYYPFDFLLFSTLNKCFFPIGSNYIVLV